MGMGQQNPPDCTESPKYKTASAGKKFRPPQKRLGETGAVYYNKREQRAQPAEKEEAHDSQCGRLPVYRLRDVRGGGAGRVSSIPPMIWLDTRKPRGVRCQRPSSSTA